MIDSTEIRHRRCDLWIFYVSRFVYVHISTFLIRFYEYIYIPHFCDLIYFKIVFYKNIFFLHRELSATMTTTFNRASVYATVGY